MRVSGIHLSFAERGVMMLEAERRARVAWARKLGTATQASSMKCQKRPSESAIIRAPAASRKGPARPSRRAAASAASRRARSAAARAAGPVGPAPSWPASSPEHRIEPELGTVKPDPAIFLAACEALGVPPEEVAYVGDDLRLDVEGAQRAGLTGIWMNRSGVVPEPILVAEGVTKSYGSGNALLVFGKRKPASRPALSTIKSTLPTP